MPPVSPSGNSSKAARRGSLLSSSRKVVSSAVRRPLRAVGRAVSGSRRDTAGRSRNSDMVLDDGHDADDDNSESGQNLVIDNGRGYGTIMAGDVEDSSGAVVVSSPLHRPAGRPNTNADWPVHSMEHVTRTLLLVAGAYLLGAKRPEWVDSVARAAEYVLTAWVTCVVILFLAFLQRKFPNWIPTLRGGGGDEEVLLLTGRGDRASSRSSIPRTTMQLASSSPYRRDLAAEELENHHRRPQQHDITRSTSTEESVASVPPEVKLSHPALSRLYIVDANTGERVFANTAEPTRISTEWFDMDMMVLIRTPDVDDPSKEKGLPCNTQWVEYLRGRQRRFEFQYQIKLKKIPVDKAVYFSCELEAPIKMGIIQRAFVGAAMAFMKSTNPTFHYSITGSKERTADGKYEKPHMSFTVEGSLDRLVVSKPGETPPQLGTAIEEDPELMKARRKGAPVDWNLEDTYTMALWSAYVDFLDWRVINLPGIRPFGLSSVLGSQAFSLTMYMIDIDKANDKHYHKDITNVVNLELSNETQAEKGPFATRWVKANEGKQRIGARTASDEPIRKLSAHESNDTLGQDMLAFKSGDEQLDDVEDDDDAETAAELGEGIYMRSGDSLCLRQLLGSAGEEEHCKGSFVSNGGGFVVLQEQDATVVIEKTRRSKKSRLIKSGDTVMFKMIQNGNKKETRYLTIHRGWWLKWVLTVPSKNGSFTILNHDGDFDKIDQVGTQTNNSESSYLTMGGSFVLRHKRWSSYFVGVASEPSPTYGGRMLGLYNPKNKDQTAEEQYQSDDGELDEGDPELKTNKLAWMKPLILSAIEPQFLAPPVTPLSPRKSIEHDESLLESVFSAPSFCSEHSQADVPAWIEIMNRRDRVRQLTYVVRVTQPRKEEQKSEDGENEDFELAEKEPEAFFRLRTGRELAQIMRVGQSVRHYVPPEEVSPRNKSRMAGIEKANSFAGRTSTPRQTSSGSGHGGTPPTSTGRGDTLLTLSPQEQDKPNMADLHHAEFSFDSVPIKDDESDDDDSIESVDNMHETDDPMIQEAFDDPEEEGEEIESEPETEDSEPEVEDIPDDSQRKKRGVLGKSKKLLGKSVKATAGGVMKTAKLGVKTTKLTGKVRKWMPNHV
jgi:hypothetical protein